MSEDPKTTREEDTFFAQLLAQPAKARRGFQTLKEQLGEETEETKAMFEIYHRAVTGEVSAEETASANGQLMDLLRIAGIATMCSVVPGSTLMLPLAVAGAKKMGIRLLPTAFGPSEDEDPIP